jgi:flagellar basal body rod protein FlgB
MLGELFGSGTVSSLLRGGLEEATATHRAIADRVARALEASSSVDFGESLQARQAAAASTEADLQRDMASLADTEIRYDADAKLLQAAYQRLRSAMKSNA